MATNINFEPIVKRWNIMHESLHWKSLQEIIMSKIKKKGPSCACGKVDLYEESLKKENKMEDTEATSSNEAEDSKKSAESDEKED